MPESVLLATAIAMAMVLSVLLLARVAAYPAKFSRPVTAVIVAFALLSFLPVSLTL